MAGSDRVFAPGEVDDLVPRLEAALGRLQTLARRLSGERGRPGRAGAPSLDALMRASAPARMVIEEIDALASGIETLGGRLTDLDLGVVDFPALLEGERVLLCWQYGEPGAAFWHRPDEGCAGRRPIPGVPHGPTLQ